MGDEEAESTLLQIRECFVYKIPPRQTNAGYKAADWHLSQPLWSGRCTITAKGNMCTIRLENQSGELFAACPIVGSTQQCVETVTDSSRYFVIRIDDGQGHHAFVGLGFTERSDAFDFNVALSDHEKHLRQMREQKQAAAKFQDAPKVDYSLKEGQTITVKIATKGGVLGASEGKKDASGPGVLTALPPPPGAKARAQVAHPAPQPVSHDVGWGEFQAAAPKASAPQGAFFAANPGGAASPYPPQVVATAAPVQASPARPGASPAYPAAVAQQSLFGQPQQQAVAMSPQMMSPQVQASPSPQMYAPPPTAQQSLFGQPQQQPYYVAAAPATPPVVANAPTPSNQPAAQPLPQAGFMNFGAPVQQQWGQFNAPPSTPPTAAAAAPKGTPQQQSLQQHQFKFN